MFLHASFLYININICYYLVYRITILKLFFRLPETKPFKILSTVKRSTLYRVGLCLQFAFLFIF